MTKRKISVKGREILLLTNQIGDYISLTDIARYQNSERTDYILQNWLRNKDTIEFLGLWEKLNNPDFKPIEFDGFKKLAGSNRFSLTPRQWIAGVNAIGLISKSGRYHSGTFAHQDIAIEFASWISPEFKLYLIKEFQRLKAEENVRQNLGWDIKRNLARINYKIHTDAIKKHIIPRRLGENEKFIYASEADLLNLALFGLTAGQWREQNPDKDGNIRDYAHVVQLVCLANLESLNAEFIRQGLPPEKRLRQLNEIAIIQLESLVGSRNIKKLGS